MKKSLRWILIASALAVMGFEMPGCPGQQVQQQVEALQASNTELGKKVQALTNQVNSLGADMNQVKQLLPQITNVIQAQKGALEQLDNTVKEMKSKKGAAAGAKKKK